MDGLTLNLRALELTTQNSSFSPLTGLPDVLRQLYFNGWLTETQCLRTLVNRNSACPLLFTPNQIRSTKLFIKYLVQMHKHSFAAAAHFSFIKTVLNLTNIHYNYLLSDQPCYQSIVHITKRGAIY